MVERLVVTQADSGSNPVRHSITFKIRFWMNRKELATLLAKEYHGIDIEIVDVKLNTEKLEAVITFIDGTKCTVTGLYFFELKKLKD